MVSIKCETPDKVKLCELTPFQGSLKKRTEQDILDLVSSIQEEGLLMPFAVWRNNGKNFLLDGHGRLEALTYMSADEPEIFKEVLFPCIYIDAETEEDARKALLQITSSYGKVTKKGAMVFTASIPNYKAPAINKVLYKPMKTRKSEQRQSDALIRIRVPVDKEKEVRDLLAQVDFITVV